MYIAKGEFLRYSEVYFDKLAIHLSGLKEVWAKSMTRLNGFIDGTLMIYLEDFKSNVFEGFGRLRLHVNEYLAKKD